MSILRKGLILVAIPLLFQLVFIGTIFRMQSRYDEAQAQSKNSEQVILEAQKILRFAVDGETGVRGFVMTGQAEYSEPYERTKDEIAAIQTKLRDHVRDDPIRMAAVDEVCKSADGCIAWLGETYNLASSGEEGRTIDHVKVGEGKTIMDDLRHKVDQLLLEEHHLENQRFEALQSSHRRINWLMAIGAGMAILLTAALAFVFWRGVSRRFETLTKNASRMANDLAASSPLEGNDEISRVDRAFREMAKDLVNTAETLRESARRTRELYDEAPCGYHSVDAAGVVVAMNKTELEWLGYTEDEVIGRMKLPDLLSPRGRNVFDDYLAAVKDRGEISNVEYEMMRKDGTTLPVMLNSKAVRDADGKFISSSTTLFDITDRKRAEEEIRRLNVELDQRVQERTAELAEANRDLSQKNQENEMFVYSVSHDLRSPLVNLQGFSMEVEKGCQSLTKLLDDERLPELVRDQGLAVLNGRMVKSLGFIKTAVLRLSGIIDALLRLSRAGRLEYRLEPVDMNKLVSQVVDAANGTINEKHATVTVKNLPETLGDRTALEQVFANLIGNALAYVDERRPAKVEVGCCDPDHNGMPEGCCVYYVKDNGLGIAEAYRHKIFQIFQRAHPGVGKGEGIGLAIVSRVVERHRGRIWVESTVGEGSTFFVALPRPT
jgi:PAS domain S-box-containing protein